MTKIDRLITGEPLNEVLPSLADDEFRDRECGILHGVLSVAIALIQNVAKQIDLPLDPACPLPLDFQIELGVKGLRLARDELRQRLKEKQ